MIEEANFIVSQNNFKDQVLHMIINNVVIDGKEKSNMTYKDIKIKSLILELKFIFLNKIKLNNITNIFKKNNLNISNIYCSSYVKTFFYKKNFNNKNYKIFLDIGYERTSCLIYKDKMFKSFNSIPIGGNNITKDISKVFKLSLDYSENLKIHLNKDSNQIIPKSISVDLLNKIILARVDEIIELAMFKNCHTGYLNNEEKPCVIFIGNGLKLLPKNYNLDINKSYSELIIYNEYDSSICEAGLQFKKSEEDSLIKTKKKIRKKGIFESFFNLFSK